MELLVIIFVIVLIFLIRSKTKLNKAQRKAIKRSTRYDRNLRRRRR